VLPFYKNAYPAPVFCCNLNELGGWMAQTSWQSILNTLIDWAQKRITERSSWDGLTIIVISILALVASPLIKYAAWLGLGYGAWTLWKTEKKL
jgi:hypothetical protein